MGVIDGGLYTLLRMGWPRLGVWLERCCRLVKAEQSKRQGQPIGDSGLRKLNDIRIQDAYIFEKVMDAVKNLMKSVRLPLQIHTVTGRALRSSWEPPEVQPRAP